MTHDDDWIAQRVAEAAKEAPVTEAAAVRLAELIRRLLTDRSLTPTELALAAKALLADMAMTPSSQSSDKPS